MTRIIEEFRRDDERVLDRLVDGELQEEDRKELLRALDDEPGAWRRCALAFLESQFWRGDFGSFRKEPPTAAEVPSAPAGPLAPAPVHPQPIPARSWGAFDFALALAACLFVAFGAGIWTRSNWSSGDGSTRPSMAGMFSPGPTVAPTTVAHMNYSDPETNVKSIIDVPVREAPTLDPKWFQQERSGMPEEVRKQLEASGHHVSRQQRFITIKTKDGRHVIVPVEQVDVEPEATPAY